MTRGISLLCIGNPHYGYFAANMALSLKSLCPDIPIQLIYEKHAIAYLSEEYLRLFDEFTQIPIQDCFHNSRLDPAKVKLTLYKHLIWDETIYLDVDGVAIRDLSGLFDECQWVDFTTQTYGQNTNSGPVWASEELMRGHFTIPSENTIPATNTSFMFIRKSEVALGVFSWALVNYHNPVPIEKIKQWGGGQPDELYFNVTLAQLGIIPTKPAYPPVYLRNRKAQGEIATVDQLKEKHYAIGIYGDANYNARHILDMYDRLVKSYSLQLLGKPNEFKWANLMEHKHVRKR